MEMQPPTVNVDGLMAKIKETMPDALRFGFTVGVVVDYLKRYRKIRAQKRARRITLKAQGRHARRRTLNKARAASKRG
jgi:hypothetical protein